MSDLSIKVEKLSKSYSIARSKSGQAFASYKTLQEEILSIPRRVLSVMQGQGSLSYETVWALNDVSFEAREGEVLGIIGRNGAGKSTLLKMLSRIIEPTKGRAEVYGRMGSLLEVGTGFHPELTGRENIFLNGSILGMRRAEITRRFDEIAAFAEVEQFLDTPVKFYSSGMYVRLAFSVAAHLDTDILVVDEVLAVGDLQFQRKCLGKMDDVAHGGRTVLFVSHNLSAVRRLCTRCVLLEKGIVLADGPTDSVIDTYVEGVFKNDSEYLQDEDGSKPINLRRVAILNNKEKKTNEIEYRDGFSVLIEYEVNQPVENCIVWVDVRTHEEIHAFGTSDYDLDASVLKPRRKGYYRTVVHIPPKLLNRGSYYIVVGITKESPYIIGYDRVEACNFSVLDSSSYALTEGSDRSGIFKPVLSWDTEKIK